MSDFCTKLSEKQEAIANSLGISLGDTGMQAVLSALEKNGKNRDNVSKLDVEMYLNLVPDPDDTTNVMDVSTYESLGMTLHLLDGITSDDFNNPENFLAQRKDRLSYFNISQSSFLKKIAAIRDEISRPEFQPYYCCYEDSKHNKIYQFKKIVTNATLEYDNKTINYKRAYSLNGRLATTTVVNKINYSIYLKEGISKEEFLNYIKGDGNSVSSEQKQKVFEVLKTKYPNLETDLEAAIDKDPDIIKKMILLHEQSHIDHLDINNYDHNKLLADVNIQIEARATEDALAILKIVEVKNKDKKSLEDSEKDNKAKEVQKIVPHKQVTNPDNTSKQFKGIVYNKEQLEAINGISKMIIDKINGRQSDDVNSAATTFITLQGQAGTGKTTIVKPILEAVAEDYKKRNEGQFSVCVAAPTHKAKNVIKTKTPGTSNYMVDASTVAALVGVREDGRGGYKPDPNVSKKIENYNIIIIDESSMINEEYLDLIKESAKSNSIIIFIGDKGQLPPVRNTDDIKLKDKDSPVFDGTSSLKIKRFNLKERVRQGEDSPVLGYADKYYDFTDGKNKIYPYLTDVTSSEDGRLVTVNANVNGIVEQVGDLYKEAFNTGNMDKVKIVAYTNARVEEYNSAIHKLLHPELYSQVGSDSIFESFLSHVRFAKGDFIVFNSSFSLPESEEITNNVEGKVISVTPAKNVNIKSVLKSNKEPLISDSLEAEGISVNMVEVTLEYKDSNNVLQTVTVPALADYNSAKNYKAFMNAQYQKSKNNNSWKTTYYPQFKFFADISLNYAITSHKSQGSTYEVVVVDAKNINSVTQTSYKAKSQSIYTALTRASNITIVNTEHVESKTEGAYHNNTTIKANNDRINSEKAASPKMKEKNSNNGLPLKTSNTIDKLKALSNTSQRKIKFDPKTHTYHNTITGKDYDSSVTQSFNLNAKKEENPSNSTSQNLMIASAIGNTVDTFCRDYFMNALKDKYPNLNAAQFAELKRGVDTFKESLDEKYGKGNYAVFTDTLYLDGILKKDNKEISVCGSPDMLLIDGEGVVHVYDFKCKAKGGISTTGFRDEPSDFEKYKYQVSMYATMLKNKGYTVAEGAELVVFKGGYTTVKSSESKVLYTKEGDSIQIKDSKKTNIQDSTEPIYTGPTYAGNNTRYDSLNLNESLSDFVETKMEDRQMQEHKIIAEELIGTKAKRKDIVNKTNNEFTKWSSNIIATDSEKLTLINNVAHEFSRTIDFLLKNDEFVKQDLNVSTIDFSNMSRKEIISKIGAGNIFNSLKRAFFDINNPNSANAEFIEDDEHIKDVISFANANYDALCKLAFAKLIALEGISVTSQAPISDFNLDEATAAEIEYSETSANSYESWMDKVRQVSTKSSLMGDLRRVFESLYLLDEDGDTEVDAFGFGVYMDSNVAVNTILSVCRNCLNVEQMESKLKELTKHPKYKYMQAILDKIDVSTADKIKQNRNFRSQFFQAFRKDFIDYSTVYLEYTKEGHPVWVTKVINTVGAEKFLFNGALSLLQNKNLAIFNKDGSINKEVLGKTIESVDALFSKFITRSYISNDQLASIDENTKNETYKNFQEALNNIGIPLDLDTIRSFFDSNNVLSNNNKKHLIDVLSLGILNRFSKGSDIKGYEPLNKEDKVNNVYTSYLQAIKIIAPYIQDAIESSSFENGKMYYSFTTPTYLSALISKFSNSTQDEFGNYAQFQEFLEEEFFQYRQFKEPSEDGYGTIYCDWLEKLSGNPEDNRKLFRHKSQLNILGNEYRDLGELAITGSYMAEYFSEYNTSNWDKAWYRLPIPSNKPHNDFIRFYKYKTGDFKGRDSKFFNVFQQELMRMKTVFHRAAIANANNFVIANFDITKNLYEKHKELFDENHTLTVQELFGNDGRNIFEGTGMDFAFLKDFLYVENEDTEKIKQYIVSYINGNITDEQTSNIKTEFGSVSDTFFQNQFKADVESWEKAGLFDTKMAKLGNRSIPYCATLTSILGKVPFLSPQEVLNDVVSEGFDLKNYDAIMSGYDNDAKNNAINELSALMVAATKKEAMSLLESYFYNDAFATINILQLTIGDKTFYKNDVDIQKRLAEVIASGLKLDTEAVFLNESGTATKYSEDGIERTIYLKDNELMSESLENIADVFDKLIASTEDAGTKAAYINTRDFVLYAFKKNNFADAQAYTSPTGMRKKLGMAGKFSDELEEAYKEIKKGNMNLHNFEIAMQPLKPYFYGATTKNAHLPNNGKATKGALGNMKVYHQNKNSEYMLLLADAIITGGNKSNRLSAIFDFMENTAYEGRVYVRNGNICKNGKVMSNDEIKAELGNEYSTKEGKAYRGDTELKESMVLKEGNYTGKGVDTIQFESAVKVGKQGILDLNNSNDYQATMDSLNQTFSKSTDAVHELRYEDYFIQQEITSHFESHEQMMGSQNRALICSDIDPEAIFDVAGNKLKGSEVKRDLNNYFAQLVKNSFEDFKKEFLLDEAARTKSIISKIKNSDLKTVKARLQSMVANYDMNESLYKLILSKIEDKLVDDRTLSEEEVKNILNTIDMSISNIEKNVKLSKLLQQAIMSDAKYSSDLLQIVDLNDDGEFNLPLFDPTISVRVQQLLNSIIKSRINKQEIAGGPVVQATSWGLTETLKVRFKDSKGKILLTESEFNNASSRPKDYSSITPEDTDYSTYVKNHQDALAYCEAYAPIQSAEMEKALTKEDGSLMTPEEALKAKIITEDALTMLGYRIPTEDKYSMTPLRVKGWVSRAAGEVIMLPSDITTLTGSDFDVDKMYIMFKELDIKKRVDTSKALIGLRQYVVGILERSFDKESEQNKKFYQTKENYAETILNHSATTKALNDIINGEYVANDTRKGFITLMEIAQKYFEEHKDSFSTTKFIATERSGRGAINNAIIDYEIAILTNKDTLPKLFNPGNFELLKDIAKKVNDAKGISNKSRNIIFSMNQVYFHQQNMTAGKLIGICANNVTSHAFLSDANITVMFGDTIKDFKLSGLSLKSMSRLDPKYTVISDSKGVHIIDLVSKTLARFLAASADAVKDPVLAALNINTFTCNTALFLLRIGYDTETVGLLMSQPIIMEAAQKYFKRNNEGYCDVNSIIEEMITDNSSRLGIGKAIDLSKEDLINNLKSRNVNLDVDILNLFAAVLPYADELNSLNMVTKLNSITSAAGPNIANNIISKKRLEKFKDCYDPKISLFSEEAYKLLSNNGNPLLKALYEATYAKDGSIEKLFNGNFPQMDSLCQSAVSAIQSIIAGNLNAKDITMITNDFMYYAMTKVSDLSSAEDRSYYINTFAKDFEKTVERLGVQNNAFIKKIFITPSTDKCPVTTLSFNTGGMSVDTTNELSAAWASLFESSNPEIQKLANDLFKYAIFRNGFGFSPKGYLHIAGIGVKRATGWYVECLRELNENNLGGLNEQNIAPFIDQFMRNHLNITKFVKDLNFNEAIILNGGNLMLKNASINSYIVKYNNKLYKKAKGTGDTGLYTPISSLGIPNNFLEYSANDDLDKSAVKADSNLKLEDENPSTNEVKSISEVFDDLQKNDMYKSENNLDIANSSFYELFASKITGNTNEANEKRQKYQTFVTSMRKDSTFKSIMEAFFLNKDNLTEGFRTNIINTYNEILKTIC